MLNFQSAIHTAEELANYSERSVAGSKTDVQNIIGYAHRLSFTTSAPPGFVPGQSQLFLHKPPAPQDVQFRTSALHQFQSQLNHFGLCIVGICMLHSISMNILRIRCGA